MITLEKLLLASRLLEGGDVKDVKDLGGMKLEKSVCQGCGAAVRPVTTSKMLLCPRCYENLREGGKVV